MRSQRGVVWPYLLLSVALLGALSFGWYQTRLKNQLARDAENKYMAAFHKLKWTSEQIEERTARLMATNDFRLQEELLADLRVFSAQAVEHMSVLPLMTLNTPRIENFLNTLRTRSDELHYKINSGQSLSAEDWSQLGELRGQSVFFEDELSHLLGLVGNNMIRWRDTVRVTAPAQSGDTTTPITASVVQLEKALQAPPGEEGVLNPDQGPLASPKMNLGPKVSEAQAIEAIKTFLGVPLKGEPRLTGRSDPDDRLGEMSLYFFQAQKANGLPLNFGVSIHGGHVIYALDGRRVQEKRFTQNQLVHNARELLRRWGYQNAEFVSAAENDGTLVMDFAPRQNGVAIHVDTIKVMLAMDNAELVGFDARNYWVNHHPRQFSGPKLTATEARKRLAPRLKVEGTPQLVLIADRRSKERLAWEFAGRVDTQRYKVFVDAVTGEEVDVQRIAGDPAPPMNEGS